MSPRHPLDLLEIPTPCPAAWNDMTGDARGRFCQHCQKTVYDLSAMSRDEGQRLVCQTAGPLCVRFTRIPDGQVQTLDYQPVTAKHHSSSNLRRLFSFAGALVCGLVSVAVYGGRVFPSPARVMGRIAPLWSMPSGPYAPGFVPPCPTGTAGDGFELSDAPAADRPTVSANQ